MSGRKKVMGFGTFDGIHPGHLNYLKQLRQLGNSITVVIARDHNVERIKGRLPKFTEDERKHALEATHLADDVILGNDTDFMQCLRDHQPDVIGLGYDQRADLIQIQTEFPSVKLVRLNSHEPELYKSSLLNT